MGDIAGGSRFVAGCARCLRSALAGIRTTDDEDGLAETRRTRRARGSSFSLAGLRLASSVAVASGSQRVRAALASIPIVDEDELEGAGQAGLRRRMALASPAVAAGLLAGAVTTAPAGAQEAPASTAAAPAQKIQPQQPPQQPQPPAPAPPPAQPPMMIELTGGAGVPTPIGPWGGELGILVNPEDGSFQFTGLGGVYAGGKLSGEYRPAREPGVVGEAKLQGGLGPYSVDLVGQTDLQSVTGSWKAQGGPLVAGQTFEVLPNPSVETRGGAQARLPGPSAVGGLVGAAGVRATSPVIPIDLLAVVDEWQNSQPIDPARFEGVPAPEDPWVSLFNWVNDQFGSQGSPQAPADSSGAGELLGAYGQQIGVPGASSGSGGLLGAYADQIGAQGGQGAQGGTLRPVDLTQIQEQFAEAWNELAEADPSGGMAATTPSADDLAVLGEALNQLWGQITGNAGNAAPGPLPVLPPAFDQLIAQDPALAQLLAQLGAQDPALAQLIVQDPALAQLLAQNPGLAQALAQDPTLAPALTQALAPVPTGEAGAPPAMDWGQILQDMNGPVLVDPEAFQDQPASDTDELDTDEADTDEADTDGVDEPAFDMDDMDDADSESDDEGEDDSESLEPESEDDSESDDGDDEEPSDDWAEDDESEPESEDDGESETDTDDGESESDDGGESEEASESDDGGEEEPSDDWAEDDESESDDDGGDESESDDEGGEEESEPESDDGGGSDESDGGGGEEGDGGGESEPAPDDSGGGGESDGGGGGETDAPAPAAPDAGPAPEEPAESAEIGPEYEADSSWTGMVEDSGTCDVC